MDFLYHKLNEKDKEEIRLQVKGILEDFSKKLSRIKEEVKEQTIERPVSTRKEKQSQSENSDSSSNSFSRKKMFENAPNKDDDFIIAEKKKW